MGDWTWRVCPQMRQEIIDDGWGTFGNGSDGRHWMGQPVLQCQLALSD